MCVVVCTLCCGVWCFVCACGVCGVCVVLLWCVCVVCGEAWHTLSLLLCLLPLLFPFRFPFLFLSYLSFFSLLSLFSLLSSVFSSSSLFSSRHQTQSNIEALECDLAQGKCTAVGSLPPPLPSLPHPEKREGTFYYRNISGEEFIFYHSFK